MNYEQAEKKLKLNFKNPRLNDKTGETEFFTREYESKLGVVKIHHNVVWKYRVFINEHDQDLFEHKHFGKRKKLIDFLISIDAKYVQKYWDY